MFVRVPGERLFGIRRFPALSVLGGGACRAAARGPGGGVIHVSGVRGCPWLLRLEGVPDHPGRKHGHHEADDQGQGLPRIADAREESGVSGCQPVRNALQGIPDAFPAPGSQVGNKDGRPGRGQTAGQPEDAGVNRAGQDNAAEQADDAPGDRRPSDPFRHGNAGPRLSRVTDNLSGLLLSGLTGQARCFPERGGQTLQFFTGNAPGIQISEERVPGPQINLFIMEILSCRARFAGKRLERLQDVPGRFRVTADKRQEICPAVKPFTHDQTGSGQARRLFIIGGMIEVDPQRDRAQGQEHRQAGRGQMKVFGRKPAGRHGFITGE